MASQIDPDDRLMEGWEPSPVPARTPNDPLPSPPRVRLPMVFAPTLCEQGPCSHYHHAVIRFDAATPMDGSASPDHTQTIRTCIPGAGVTLELEDRPVFECSYWDPGEDLQRELKRRRELFASSPAGAQYASELEAWHADQARIRTEIEHELAQPAVELSALETSVAELQPGDVLELRVKGKPLLLERLTYDQVKAETFELRFDFPPDTYQLRRVNADGAIVSTRLYTHESKETLTP